MTGKLLGHAQVETTARYAHLARDSVHETAERVAASIAADILGEEPAGADGTKPPNGGERHHRRLEDAVLQGRQGPAGRGALAFGRPQASPGSRRGPSGDVDAFAPGFAVPVLWQLAVVTPANRVT